MSLGQDLNERTIRPHRLLLRKDLRMIALDLLHARVFQRCLEGDLGPVYYMGEPVGYIRKFSDKLQIELLRAYRPDQFKTPGTNVNINDCEPHFDVKTFFPYVG